MFVRHDCVEDDRAWREIDATRDVLDFVRLSTQKRKLITLLLLLLLFLLSSSSSSSLLFIIQHLNESLLLSRHCCDYHTRAHVRNGTNENNKSLQNRHCTVSVFFFSGLVFSLYFLRAANRIFRDDRNASLKSSTARYIHIYTYVRIQFTHFGFWTKRRMCSLYDDVFFSFLGQ